MKKRIHPADIADILRNLPSDKRKPFFDSLDSEVGARVLRQLDPMSEFDLLKKLDSSAISEILDEMPSDDAADVVAGLSKEKAGQVLKLMTKEDSARIQNLLKYDSETAGGIMTTDFVALNAEINAEQAIHLLRQRVKPGPIHYVYVVDNEQRLLGVLMLKKLLVSEPDIRLKDIMNEDIVSVKASLDQEEVARLVSKYDLLAIPVVDEQNHLIGVVTVDDIIDVLKEEATEDIFKLGGTDDEELSKKSTFNVSRVRLPWLVVTLFEGIICATLIRFFQFTLERTIALAFFIPVIMGMGGNIGIQSSTIVVRGLATGRINLSQIGKVLFREIRVGLIMGLVCGSVVALIAYLLEKSLLLGMVVGISMFIAIIVAATMGSLIPLIFKRLKIDPAVASGPFITSSNDIVGILIYFSLANLLFRIAG